MNRVGRTAIWICFWYLLCSVSGALGNTDSLKNASLPDTNRNEGYVARLQQFARESAKSSKADLEADRISIRQEQVINAIRVKGAEAEIYLKKRVDTVPIKNLISHAQYWKAIAGDGIFINRGKAQTYRNLTTSGKIFSALSSVLSDRKVQLDNHLSGLEALKFDIDSIASDSALFIFPTDSVRLSKYFERLRVLAYEIAPVDSALSLASANLENLQHQLNVLLLEVKGRQGEIETYQQTISDGLMEREFVNIWEASSYNRPVEEIISMSKAKAALILHFYLKNNQARLVLFLLLTGISVLLTHSLVRRYALSADAGEPESGSLVFRYPRLSAIVISWSLFQFIFPSPPFVLNIILWVVPILLLSFIFRNYVPPFWFRFWLILIVLFVGVCLINLVLQASRPERWAIFLFSTFGIVHALAGLSRRKRTPPREKWIIYPIGALGIFCAAALISDVFGRYNLANTLLVAGYLNVVIAILFLWVVRLLMEAFVLTSMTFDSGKKASAHKDGRLMDKAPGAFYLFFLIGWCILFGRNFYAFRLVSEPFVDFLEADRSLGEFKFSIAKFLIFALIMLVSTVLSRAVSFFTSAGSSGADSKSKSGRLVLGSWLLLVRITIIVTGLLLAFASTGIQMNQIAIIIGALGVGIGFGLQSLVNNLVSGLIIAFEKPVNVGDLIELDGQKGVVQAINFRSSIILTPDGAELVLPNGDLLNSHVLNWNSGKASKRFQLVLKIAYGQDLLNVKQIVLNSITADTRILKLPTPVIQFQEFGGIAIELTAVYWVKHLAEGGDVKSDLIINIERDFRNNGIVIPRQTPDITT